jgi:predicted RNA-binding protein
MCLAKLYRPGENDKPALENITSLTIEGDKVNVETLFGEKKVFSGKVQRIDFAESKIHLEEVITT